MQGRGNRGQSEVLGSILLVAIVVLFLGLVGAAVLAPVGSTDAGPVVDVGVSVTPGAVNLDHDGGDTVAADDVVVVIDGPEGSSRTDLAAGHPDATFEPGDTAVLGGQSFNPGDEVRVRVIHVRSNRLLYDGRKFARFPPSVTATRLVWSSSSDWDEGQSTRIVHDDVGDRIPTRLRLGYESSGPSAPGLVSYYPLDGTGGVTVEDATGLNDGTLKDDSLADHDAYDRGVPGVFGGTAIHFEPQKTGISFEKGAYVDLGSRTASHIADGSFTWSAWVKTDREGGGKEAVVSANHADRSNNVLWFLCKPGCYAGDDDDQDARLAVHDGSFHRDDGGGDGVVNDGDWHHIAVTLDDSTGRVTYYVDGSEVHSFTTGHRIGSDDVMSLAQDSDNADYGFGTGTSDFLEGHLDEVRIYDRVLTPDEIEQLDQKSGIHLTGPKHFTDPASGDSLRLNGVDADVTGGSVTVYVEADPDLDGTYEHQSDPIALNSADSTYAVEFPNDVSATAFRLRIELDTSTVAGSPTVDRIDLETV
jgi:flagellin-like protein